MLLSRADGRLNLQGYRHTNVWEFPRVSKAKSKHPAEKPVALLRRAISCFTARGSLVVDPYCGSGATGEAARAEGCSFLLGDIDTDYVRISRKRLGLAVEDSPLPESTTPPENQPFNLDLLSGIHPEDLQDIAQYIQQIKQGSVLTEQNPSE